jgi:oligoribonuclease
MSDPNDKSTKLLWLDMEMTGLNSAVDRILEVAAIVTDFDFNELDTYESVVYQPPEVMARMDEWCRESHTASGLVDRVKAAPNEQHVLIEFEQFVKRNFNEPAVLAGSSIHQDRRFIRQWWQDVDKLLHYRMLDVSSFKIIMFNKYGVEFVQHKEHRALDDIRRSINELKFYLEHLNK